MGCGSKRRRTARTPAPPPPAAAKIVVPKNAKPIFVETGLASWYGGVYHNRRSSNGDIYDMNAPTAAHRTYPFNSIVRVTNLKTGSMTLVRITDRGPFVENRIIDLSMVAAKEADVWRPGVARVKLEVLQAPKPLDHGGRWAVQFGAFKDEDPARRLRDRLAGRYPQARVIHFSSPVGDWWVRIRVPEDDRKRAFDVAAKNPPSQGQAYLVRLD
ncbi:MAG: septal ring lytic transglycosylase RlpA family protein [Terriglobales bacterium]